MVQKPGTLFRPWIRFVEQNLGVQGLVSFLPQNTYQGSFVANLTTFLCICGATFAVAVVSTAGRVEMSTDARVELLRLFLCFLAMAWLAAALTLHRWSPKRFVRAVGFVAILSLPVAGVGHSMGAGREAISWFWLSILLWSLLAVLGTWGNLPPWRRFMTVAAALWVVVGVLVTLGLNPWLPYSRSAVYALRSVHQLLEVRLLLTAVFFTSLVGEAFVEAWRNFQPHIPQMPRKHVQGNESDGRWWVKGLLNPFLGALDLMAQATQVVIDVLWRLVATIILFFIEVGTQVGSVLRRLVMEHSAVTWVTTLVATYLLLLGLFAVASETTTSAWAYVTALTFGGALRHLGVLSISVAVSTICVAGLVGLVEEAKDMVVETTLSALMFLLATLLVV